MDFMTSEQRSNAMSKVHSKDTEIERNVRSLLHKKGFRYRINLKQLPGRPDVVMKKFKVVIFINGCFWHGHLGCKKSTLPSTRKDFWKNKINGNIKRDKMNINKLIKTGWRVAILWECCLINSVYIHKSINLLLDWINKSETYLEIPEK